MFIKLNFKSGKPAYLQLVDQIKAAAASGVIRAGEALPAIRPLAEELRLNRNTVSRAYSELENQGIIQTISGKGCFVAENNSPFKKQVRDKMLAEEIDGAIVQAHHLQVEEAEFLKLVAERLELFKQRNKDNAERK
jgi:GntR family transcriptional regulator